MTFAKNNHHPNLVHVLKFLKLMIYECEEQAVKFPANDLSSNDKTENVLENTFPLN